ncbi:mycothiol transferase [Streptomyces werraensis]|uniref:mycothiol transferase n=1 Tax=Streptomyces werraensis TaxID=68284 RepID=UPI0036A529F0
MEFPPFGSRSSRPEQRAHCCQGFRAPSLPGGPGPDTRDQGRASCCVFADQDVLRVFGKNDVDGFAIQPERGLDEAMAAWQAEVARGRELIAEALLNDSGRLSEQEAGHVGEQGVSLRWIMVHVI